MRAWHALLVTSVGVNALKGLPVDVQAYGFPHWKLTYAHGFIRRGLVGTVFQAFSAGNNAGGQRAQVLQIHAALVTSLFILLGMWWREAEKQPESDVEALRVGACAFALSSFVPTQLDLVGYLDIFLLLISASATFLLWRGRPLIAGALGALGPFVHDGFVFLWLGVAVLGVREGLRANDVLAKRRMAALAAPFASMVLVLLFHSPTAAAHAIEDATTPDVIRESFVNYQFGLGPLAALSIMLTKFRVDYVRTLAAALWFGVPSLVIARCAARSDRTSSGARGVIFAAFATLAPCTILLVAWDLSRFLLWSAFGGLLALLSATPYRATTDTTEKVRTPVRPSRSERKVQAAILAVLAGLAWSPRVFAYFEVAFASVHFGPALLIRTPAADLTYSFLGQYNRTAFATSYDSSQPCTLAVFDGASLSADRCVVSSTGRGLAETPALWLQRGTYEVMAETTTCAGTMPGRVSIESTPLWRFEPRIVRASARAGEPLTMEVSLSAAESTLSQFVVRVAMVDGCTELQRVVVRRTRSW